MLTWMIYAVSVSAVLSAAALIAEHSARQRRSSSRWFWLLAIVASLAIPAAMTSVSIDIARNLDREPRWQFLGLPTRSTPCERRVVCRISVDDFDFADRRNAFALAQTAVDYGICLRRFGVSVGRRRSCGCRPSPSTDRSSSLASRFAPGTTGCRYRARKIAHRCS